jgi:hypothetical protein
MDSSPTLAQFLAPKGENLEPPSSSHPIHTSVYEVRPGFIAMSREQSFAWTEEENPYIHLKELEQLCSCITIEGMTQETLKWILFPFSLTGREKQWYNLNVRSVEGKWEVLREKFCHTHFLLARISDLQCEIMLFKQKEGESLGTARAQFTIS